MKKTYYYLTALFLSYIFPRIVLGTGGGTGGGQTETIKNPLKSGTDTIPEILVLIIDKFIMPIGGVAVAFMIIYTGFLFVTAQGNESKLTDAKKTLTHTIIGAIIILGAFSISVIIQSTIGEITDAIQ